ncbi:hypothetical protein [Chitinasiproducens palmae]|uniref:Uncharacterized protein n=1 Tax=Chitinasiproducens palmae TaxID=1770053 RepID=A0A1H2PQV7_9BURK|nr:hypothetical protein [Chitinasiproducens palmae]SDV49233.1 hypothetical protein SAMN05216551_107170 [Chitinasiproducens palmae]
MGLFGYFKRNYANAGAAITLNVYNGRRDSGVTQFDYFVSCTGAELHINAQRAKRALASEYRKSEGPCRPRFPDDEWLLCTFKLQELIKRHGPAEGFREGHDYVCLLVNTVFADFEDQDAIFLEFDRRAGSRLSSLNMKTLRSKAHQFAAA